MQYLGLKSEALNGMIKGFVISFFLTAIFLVKNFLVSDTTSTNNIIINTDMDYVIVIAGLILAGLFEEIVFRGFYYNIFKTQLSFWMANLTTSVLFALLHIQHVVSGNIVQVIMLFVISLWLGYLYEKTSSLYSPMIVHAFYNVLTFLL
jgi:membrane protease YdiL (CAAX protease family)